MQQFAQKNMLNENDDYIKRKRMFFCRVYSADKIFFLMISFLALWNSRRRNDQKSYWN